MIAGGGGGRTEWIIQKRITSYLKTEKNIFIKLIGFIVFRK